MEMEAIKQFKERTNRLTASDEDVKKLLDACDGDVNKAVSLIENDDNERIFDDHISEVKIIQVSLHGEIYFFEDPVLSEKEKYDLLEILTVAKSKGYKKYSIHNFMQDLKEKNIKLKRVCISGCYRI